MAFFQNGWRDLEKYRVTSSVITPDSKVHGDNMGPIWGRQDPGGPNVGPMNFAVRDVFLWYNSAGLIEHLRVHFQIISTFFLIFLGILFNSVTHLNTSGFQNGSNDFQRFVKI